MANDSRTWLESKQFGLVAFFSLSLVGMVVTKVVTTDQFIDGMKWLTGIFLLGETAAPTVAKISEVTAAKLGRLNESAKIAD